jgi:hypothetical protein
MPAVPCLRDIATFRGLAARELPKLGWPVTEGQRLGVPPPRRPFRASRPEHISCQVFDAPQQSMSPQVVLAVAVVLA